MPICIGVDCDEVLSETMDQILKQPIFKEKGIKKSDITSYNLFEITKLGMTLEDAISLFFSFFESPEYRETQPVLGAYEKLYELKKSGHKLYVVTARDKPFERQTRKRVETHFPGIFSDFLFMSQYTENEIPKSQLCKEKGIQLLIDDIVQNIQDVNSLGIPGFLLDKPRNQGVEDSELLHRVHSRDEINCLS